MVKEKSMYDIIKHQNGEAFARAIRQFDSGIFEVPNLPHIVRYAGRNALPLLAYLEGLKINIDQTYKTDKSPFQLLKEAGYDAFYADTLEKQNSIQKYFAKGEELCTFHDEMRFKNYHIIHAIKKNVDSIKRENFDGIEEREDEYGTSVISIQILKTGGFISIKNRYNHTVENPDNTFHSNPDNIIKGLSYALQRHFKVDFQAHDKLLGDDYTYQNGQIFKFVDEMNNVYFGEDFYLKNGVVYPVNKDYQLMANEFLIDFKEKKILNIAISKNNLFHVLKDELEGSHLSVQKKGGRFLVFADEREILAIQAGVIKRLSLYKTKELNDFLITNFDLEEFYGYQVREIKGDSFERCTCLKKAFLPCCEKISLESFYYSRCQIQAPKMEENGFYFLCQGIAFSPNLKLFYLRGKMNRLFFFLTTQMKCYNHFKVQKEERGHLILADEKPFLRFKDNQLTGIYLHKGCKRLDRATISELAYLEEFFSAKTTYVEAYNFSDCPMLRKIQLPNVKTINSLGSFCHLKALQEVYLDRFQPQKYPKMLLFSSCPKLKKIHAPLIEVNETVEYCYPFGVALENLKSLESFKVKNGVIVQNNGLKVGHKMIYDELLFIKKERGARE